MDVYVPNYYGEFSCVASKCVHSCCKDWEIDVDDKSLKRFELNTEVNKHIKDGAIVLTKDERCPFLRKDGLCQMIIDYGEDYLCDICKDHPRFRNFYDDHIEMGLGLCCEEAVRVVLSYEGKFKLVNINDANDCLYIPEEFEFFLNRSTGINERLNALFVSEMASDERARLYYDLERLDDNWSKNLQLLIDNPVTREERERFISDNALGFEQLAVYFLYRHNYNSEFTVESCNLIADLCVKGLDLYDTVRMYSSEVEYSDTNIETLVYEVFF